MLSAKPLLLLLFLTSWVISPIFENILIALEDLQKDTLDLSEKVSPHVNMYHDLLNQAEQFFEAALYEKAIPIYQQIIQAIRVKEHSFAISPQDQATVRYRLGQSYFLNENYQAAINILQTKNEDILNPNERPPRELYLLAISYRKAGNFERAITALRNYLKSEDRAKLSFYEEAQFELGLAYFLWGKFETAKQIFFLLTDQIEKTYGRDPLNHTHLLSRRSLLYLARIDNLQGNYEESKGHLDMLKPLLSDNDILRYELAYLQGEAFFQVHDYINAIAKFEQAIPQHSAEKTPWYSETLYHMGWSYMNMAMNEKLPALQREYFEKAELVLKKLTEQSQQEKDFLALGQYYLTRAQYLKDEFAYKEAEKLLARQEIFKSREVQAHALLLRAEAAPSYALRDSLYRHLTQEGHRETPFYAKGWYLRGLNDFEEGQRLLATQEAYEATKAFERAISSLKKAFELLQADQKKCAGLALKYQAQAFFQQNTEDGTLQALTILDFLLKEHPEILMTMDDPDEIYYLQGLFALHLAKEKNEDRHIILAESSAIFKISSQDSGKRDESRLKRSGLSEESMAKAMLDEEDRSGEVVAGRIHDEIMKVAENSLQQGLARFPKGKFASAILHLLGTLYYQRNDFPKAEATFLTMATEYPTAPIAGDALFWAARCADRLQDLQKSKEYRCQVYERYPQSSFAAEAYFLYHSYLEYVQGDREAIKHLQAMPKKYPDSPFAMNAWYLIGLDYKRDRKTTTGKWICKRNLTAAIEAFQQAELTFDSLYQKHLLTDNRLEDYVTVRYRATLERALTNLAIADESQGAKKQIYLEYATDVFRQIYNDFKNPQHGLHHQLADVEACANIQEEATYWLAQAYLKANQDAAAEEVLTEMLERYRSAKVTRGYFLSRAWYDLGFIAACRQEYKVALQCYMHAEDTAKGKVLNTDQRLDLWIQQSLSYKALGDRDQAILVLSRVVNDDAVSGLRIKAMYLRAEIYETQGRPELARKQLEATSKKGGEWSLKAKTKLDKEYGYQ